jgi:hypothetical protein
MYTQKQIEEAFQRYKFAMSDYMESIKNYNIAKTNMDSTYQKMLHKGDIWGKNDDARTGHFISVCGELYEDCQNAKLETMNAEIDMRISEIDVRCIDAVIKSQKS